MRVSAAVSVSKWALSADGNSLTTYSFPTANTGTEPAVKQREANAERELALNCVRDHYAVISITACFHHMPQRLSVRGPAMARAVCQQICARAAKASANLMA